MNNVYRGHSASSQNFRAGQDMILIIEVVMDIICEVIKDIGIIITITEGMFIEVEINIASFLQ